MNLKLIVGLVLLLSGCAVKDQSFYDLKSPCVSISGDDLNPCVKTSPILNDVILHA